MLQAGKGSLSCLALVGCAVLVFGCHKKPEKAPAPAPAPVIAVKPSPPLPPRSPGLWETTVTEEGSEDAPQILQICIDAMTDQHLGILGTDLSGDKCSKKTFSRNNDGSWGLLAECDMGSSNGGSSNGGTSNGATSAVTEYSGSISGDYTSDYTMKLRSQTTNPSLPQMNRVTNYTVASKRLGACAKDQSPGDVINEGIRMNLFDMAGMRPKGQATSSALSDAPADAGE